MDPVRYTPEMSAEDPGDAPFVQQIVDEITAFVAHSATATTPATRGAHAKGYGGVHATVEVLADLPPRYAQGLFATPMTYDALIRFSNGRNHVAPDDQLGCTTGASLKIFGVPGKKLAADAPDSDTFNIPMMNTPIFFSSDIRTYGGILKAIQEPAGPQMFYDFLTGFGQLPKEKWLWEDFLAAMAITATPPMNLLLYTYWSMLPSRYGDYVAKISLAPDPAAAAGVALREPPGGQLTPTFFSDSLVPEISERGYTFLLRAQLCADLALTPIENVARRWPEALTPSTPVAKVSVAPQQVIDPEVVNKLSFDPWCVTAEHEPLGGIARARRAIYPASSHERRTINKQPLQEPSSFNDAISE